MSDDELAKDLGLLSAMTIGIGTMIGAGGGSLVFSVLEEIDTPVVLAERPSSRSLCERLFGRR